MKKSTVLVAALALTATSAFAQLTNKNGEAYLPESGDYAIGIDAAPVLSYFGNALNGNTNNAPFGWQYTNVNTMITGKMFTSETTAYRVGLRIGFNTASSTQEIPDASVTTAPTFPDLPATVEDKMKSSSRSIGLAGGMEWRRGKGRLQGYYGGMGMIWLSGSKTSYEYGNTLTNTSVAGAISYDFGTNINPASTTYGNNARVTSMKGASTLGIGVRGFVGAEYFVLPKLSIGGEFGWGIGFSSSSRGEVAYEAVNGTNVDNVTEATGSKAGGLSLDTDNAAFGMAPAAILIHFHF